MVLKSVGLLFIILASISGGFILFHALDEWLYEVGEDDDDDYIG